MAPALTMKTPINATSVAARRRLESDTSLPIITQTGWPPHPRGRAGRAREAPPARRPRAPAGPVSVTLASSRLALILEVVRARYAPAIRAQVGLLAYAVVALVTRGDPFSYVNPVTGHPFADPIGIWFHYFGPQAAPIDPV